MAIVSRLEAPDVRVYVGALCIGAGATFVLLWRSRRASARLVLAVSVLLHAIALSGLPAFEDDFYRFIWDGWRTLASGSPYGVPPEHFFVDPSVPAPLHRILDGINSPEHPTIYGPVLEALFALTFLLGGANPLALRIAFSLANIALIALLMRRTAPHHAALYAWSPFALAEIVLHVHPDGVMALFLFVALMAAAKRPALAGAALGLAAGAKIVALAAWPILLRLPPRAAVAAMATLGAVYLPFVLQPTGAGFETTAMFAQTWLFNPLGFALVDALLPADAARLACAALGLAAILTLHARAKSASETPLAAIFGAILLVAPTVNAWYLLWAAPFAAGRAWAWLYAAALALPLSYLNGLYLEAPNLASYAVHPYAWSAELLIIAAALCYDAYRRRTALLGR